LASTWAAKSKASKAARICAPCRSTGGSQTSEYSNNSQNENGSRPFKRPHTDDLNQIVNEPELELSQGKTHLLKAFESMLKRELQRELNPLKDKVSGLESLIVQSQEDSKVMNERISEIEARSAKKEDLIENLDQYSRRNNVIIDGIPEMKNEKPVDTIKRIASATEFGIDIRDIDACHRLPNRRTNNPDEPRRFIIKYCK